MTVWNNGLLLCGGKMSGVETYSRTCYYAKLGAVAWTKKADLKLDLHFGAFLTLNNGSVWAAGGYNGNELLYAL